MSDQQAASDLIGRLDKPFHRPECTCDECLRWIAANPLPQPAILKRYDCAITADGDCYMREGERGMWVFAAECMAVIAERDAARQECERLKELNRYMDKPINAVTVPPNELHTKLNEAVELLRQWGTKCVGGESTGVPEFR